MVGTKPIHCISDDIKFTLLIVTEGVLSAANCIQCFSNNASTKAYITKRTALAAYCADEAILTVDRLKETLPAKTAAKAIAEIAKDLADKVKNETSQLI